MASVSIKPSLDKIRKWIEQIASPEAKRRVLIRASAELADRARVYPAEGAWNYQPGVGKWGWYQRQFGPRRMRKDGSIWGKNTSQKLQKNWKVEIKPGEDQASVYTNVTYAPYLFDPDQRVHWAASHGWQTVDEIAEDYTPRFEQIILDEIDKQLDKPTS